MHTYSPLALGQQCCASMPLLQERLTGVGSVQIIVLCTQLAPAFSALCADCADCKVGDSIRACTSTHAYNSSCSFTPSTSSVEDKFWTLKGPYPWPKAARRHPGMNCRRSSWKAKGERIPDKCCSSKPRDAGPVQRPNHVSGRVEEPSG